MTRDLAFKLTWIRVGGVCGLLSILSYLSAAFLPLPDIIAYTAAFAFGPLLAVGMTGLYHCLTVRRRSVLLQIAVTLAFAGGITVLIMLTTQQAIFSAMESVSGPAGEPGGAETIRLVEDGLNAVHYGIDVAWDVLISSAVILFGIGMLSHERFGRIFGSAGILLGTLLLVFNLWHFPSPPAAAGSIDWGPAVALWLLIVSLQLLRSLTWARGQGEEN